MVLKSNELGAQLSFSTKSFGSIWSGLPTASGRLIGDKYAFGGKAEKLGVKNLHLTGKPKMKCYFAPASQHATFIHLLFQRY